MVPINFSKYLSWVIRIKCPDLNLESAEVLEVEQAEDLEGVAQRGVGLPQLRGDAHAVLGEGHRLALQ